MEYRRDSLRRRTLTGQRFLSLQGQFREKCKCCHPVPFTQAQGSGPVVHVDGDFQFTQPCPFRSVLNSKDQRAKARGGGATSGDSKEKWFFCMFCNKGFSCPQKVEVHQRVHTGVKSFSCTQCHMHFAQTGDLKRHQRVHTGVKPFSCTQCHMRFAQTGDLKRHQRVHTGEKPYSCPQCEKRFSHQHHLKMHLNVHTGERPFREKLPQDTPAEKTLHYNIESNHSTR
ncbi:gastrula zinc finger protein XlCGF49.1-like [Salmo trutta]|uniref:gastrula zinc finger protein XlCGF49.1-like n=1 Tax=Salmo trutta TaxID=8032 RepID=UPI00113232B1|nr:gastrula zinc finger protein XlCGF49.1-like [Salmo trutta]